MTKFSFKVLVERTGLPEYTVRYRLEKLGIGEKVGERFFLYTDDDVKRVRDYDGPEPSKQE